MKTYTINLSGKIFNIDETALAELQKYIDALKAHYSKESGGDEIMYDIESRVGELFLEYQKQEHREVVTIPDVERIIGTMGAPNVIFDDDQPRETASSPQKPEPASLPKKLFRDPQDHVFGGVASGLAHYLDAPVFLIRICFLLMMLCYGVFFIVYIFMWILVPKAVTPSQRLQMRGKKINVSDIEDAVRSSYQEIRDSSKVLSRRGCLYNTFKVMVLFFCCYILLVFSTNIFNITFPTLFNPYIHSFISPIVHLSFIRGPLGMIDILLGALIFVPISLFAYLLIQALRSVPRDNQKVIRIAVIIWLAIFFASILIFILR